MRFSSEDIVDNMRVEKHITGWNIFYTAFKSEANISNLRLYIEDIPDWSLCVFPRWVKYIESLIRNRYQIGLVAQEFEYSNMGMQQMFARIESALELEYNYRKAELGNISNDKIEEADREILKLLVDRDKDWDKKVSDQQMQLVILAISGYTEDQIAKALRMPEKEIYEKLFRRGSDSVVEILEKGA